MKNIFVITVLVSLSLNVFGKSLKDKKIILGAANWCPYTCPTMANQGFVTEFVKKILKENGIELEVHFYPWKRAVSMARSGELSGLLTATHREAPDLFFTKYPSTDYQSCFFSSKPGKKGRISEKDLVGKKIGVISGYSYGDKIDEFLDRNKKNIIVVHGEDGLNRLKNLERSKRIDYFLEDDKVTRFKLGKGFKPVFCGDRNPVFLAVNKKLPVNSIVLSILNKEFQDKKAKLIVMQWLSMLK